MGAMARPAILFTAIRNVKDLSDVCRRDDGEKGGVDHVGGEDDDYDGEDERVAPDEAYSFPDGCETHFWPWI